MDISYSLEGPADAPALLLSNSIGTTRALWDPQAPAFARRFRLIRYDTRGHGQSAVTPGDYTVEQLGRDVVAILDEAGIAQAHVCGLSLGGITAMWLGVNAPDRVSKLVLANTGARIGSAEMWGERMALVRSSGMAGVAERAIPVWLSQPFREANPATEATFKAMLLSCPPAGYLGCCAAMRDEDLREAITAISCPTLVIGGSKDMATKLELSEFTASHIPGAQLVTLDSAHLSNVERPDEFTRAVLEFLG